MTSNGDREGKNVEVMTFKVTPQLERDTKKYLGSNKAKILRAALEEKIAFAKEIERRAIELSEANQ